MATEPGFPDQFAAGQPDAAVRVVLVEDHAVLRQQLVRLMARAGMRVLAAVGSVHDGWQAVTAHLPDVAVIDNHLPDGRGIDLCRDLRRDTPRVTVLVHSGASSPDEVREALDAGAAAMVPKTVRGQALLWAIQQHAAGGGQ